MIQHPKLSARARTLFDSLPVIVAVAALRDVSGYAALQPLAKNIVAHARERLRAAPSLPDSAMLLAAIAYSDAMRGTVDSSGARHLTFGERVQLAQVGVWSTSSIADETRTAIKSNQAITMASGVAALSAQHDTAALALMVASLSKFDTLSRAAGGGGGTKFADGARAYEILARGDTSAALLKFLALPTVNCRGIPCAAFNVARLLVRAKRETDAARVLDRWLPSGQGGVGAFAAMLLRAEIAARAGDKATAKHWIDAVIARWSGGSAAVQPSVKAAREGLRSLPGGGP